MSRCIKLIYYLDQLEAMSQARLFDSFGSGQAADSDGTCC